MQAISHTGMTIDIDRVLREAKMLMYILTVFLKNLKVDDFVKSPYTALRFILCHSDVNLKLVWEGSKMII
jgi:hypothetical protein